MFSYETMAWLDPIWKTVASKTRMSRRKVASVKKYSSEQDLVRGAKTRGYHVARVGNQYFIFRDAIDVKA